MVTKYRDLDLGFARHPITNDLSVLTDDNAIKTSMKHLLFMNHYDNKAHPEIGSNITGLLFDIVNPITAVHLKRAITEVLTNFEPRILIIDISIVIGNNQQTYDVTILFSIINVKEPSTLSLSLERIR